MLVVDLASHIPGILGASLLSSLVPLTESGWGA